MANKKKNTKLSIDEYLKARDLKNKDRFKIEFYPWPVMAALIVPLATLIFLITVYFLHIRNVAR